MKKLLIVIALSLWFPFVAYAGPPGSPPADASTLALDTANFDGELSPTENTLQLALDALDDVVGVGDTTETNQDDAWNVVPPNTVTGTQTFITVTYQDATNDVDFVVPVLNEDDMATDSDTNLATQQSIKAYVDAQSLALTADSVQNSHIDWADLDNLGEEGTLTVADTVDTTSFVGLFESATGDLAAKTDAGLTYNAATGVLTATGFVGPITGDVTGAVTAVTVADTTDTTSFIGMFESADGDLGPKTDLGLTYNAGTGVLTATGFAGPITGAVTGNADTATLAATLTIADNESTNENNAVVFLPGGDLDGGNLALESDGTFYYNPSTGIVTATGFAGALTGNVTGNASGTALTVTQAAQTAITSLGTQTTLAVDNITINGNDISSTAGTDLTISPLEGQQIVLDATIVVDAGVVTGATSITSDAFVGALTGNADTVTTNANLSGDVTSSGSNATTIADSVAVTSWALTTPGVTGGATFTDANITPNANGELVYDNTVAGVDDGAFAYFAGTDTVYFLPGYAVLPTDSEDDFHLAYDKDTDRLYWKTDATGGSPVMSTITSPEAAWAITAQDTENIAWTTQTTASDYFRIDATGAFGDYSIAVIEQKTGNPTNGTLLELKTADAEDNVDQLLMSNGTDDYVTHHIVEAGTYTIDVTSDNTALIALADNTTVTGVLTATSVVIGDTANIGSASDTDAIAIAADGKTTFTQDMNLSEDLLIGDAKYIGSASDADAMQIEADGDIVFTQDIAVVDVVASGTVSANHVVPAAADGLSDIGASDNEFGDAYFHDSAVIYAQQDRTNTMTSSANGWDFGLSLGIADDKFITYGGNLAGRDWTVRYDATGGELEYTHTAGNDANVRFDLNDSGADSTYVIENSDGTYEANVTIDGDLLAGTVTIADATITDSTGAIGFGNENLTTTGTLTSGKHTLNNVLDLYSADANPAAQGELLHDTTITGVMSGGGLRWYDDNSVRLIVDLETDPADDDYVVAYDSAADGFYMKLDANTGSSPRWDEIENPNTADEIDFGANAIELNVQDFQIGDGGGVNIVKFDGSGATWYDEMPLEFGSNKDWYFLYDEDGDDQLLLQTTNTAAIATTDPMFEILVGTTPTANQQVFGVAKGTQDTNTPLFTVDEDGDVEIAGTTLLTGAVTIGSGGTPATAGTIMLKNADSIQFRTSEDDGNVNALSVDSSEIVQIAASGADGVVITPATTITEALTLSSTFTDGILTGDGIGGITGLTNLNSVLAAELAQLETMSTTTISAAQWAGLGGATTAGMALWDDATAGDQLTTMGAAPAAGSSNIVTVGAVASGSLAAGFTDVPVAQGGTGASTLALNGVLYGNAAAAIGVTAIGAAGQILRVGADPFVPAWSTSTFADTYAIGGLLVASGANTVTALATGTTGQILVGATGAVPAWGVDLPTATTIGSGYVYRVGGTDVNDANVEDDITLASTKKISTLLTTEQLRLSYDAGNYAAWAVDATGATTVTTVDADGAVANLTFSPNGTIILTPATDVVGALTAGSVASDAAVSGTSITDGTATLTGGALTGLTTPLTVAQGGTGATTNTPTNITPVDTGEEAAAFYPVLVDGTTGDQATETDAAFNYNPNTDTLTIVNLDVLGAPFPADPGADRVLSWDDSETGAELIWAAATGTDDQTLAEVLASAADANDVDTTSWGLMSGFDAGLYLDWDADGVIDLTSDGTLELHSNDWDISATGDVTGVGAVTADGIITGLVNTSADVTAVTNFNGTFAVTTAGNIAFTLPTAAAGHSICLYQGKGRTDALSVTAASGDYIVLDGVAGTVEAGGAESELHSAGAATDRICLVSMNADDWYVSSSVGTWAE